MKLKSIGTVVLAIWLLAISSPAYCWDKYAHMVICQIAYTRMTPKARVAVSALIAELNKNPEVTGLDADDQPYNSVSVGAWMDNLKSIDRQYNDDHFVDLPFVPNTTAADVREYDAAKGAPQNAYGTIERMCLPIINNPAADTANKAAMLGFLTHLVGDVHQPLHAVGRDHGGNDYKIDGLPSFDASWQINNLHAFWDNAYRYDSVDGKVAVVAAGIDHPRPTLLDSGPLFDFAAYLVAHYPPQKKPAEQSDPAEWVAESARIACTVAFPSDSAHTLSPQYVHMAHEIACRRLVLAGCRLGNLLNSLYDK